MLLQLWSTLVLVDALLFVPFQHLSGPSAFSYHFVLWDNTLVGCSSLYLSSSRRLHLPLLSSGTSLSDIVSASCSSFMFQLIWQCSGFLSHLVLLHRSPLLFMWPKGMVWKRSVWILSSCIQQGQSTLDVGLWHCDWRGVFSART